jgi:tRNA(adenine34) deaminase
MGRALVLAELAAGEGEVPVGAVLVADGKMLSEGWNRPVTSNDPSAHAEIQTLRLAGRRSGNYRLPGTTLYVTLEPCLMCAGALIHARIDRLVFGAADPNAGAVVSLFKVLDDDRLNHRVQYDGGVLAEESSKMLRRFFQARRSSRN